MGRDEAHIREQVREPLRKLEQARREGDLLAESQHLGDIAAAWSLRYPHRSALYLKEQLSVVESLGDEEGVASILIRLGQAYWDGGYRARSFAYWRLALESQQAGEPMREVSEEIPFDQLKGILREKAFNRAWRSSSPLFLWLRLPWRADVLPRLDLDCQLAGDPSISPYFRSAEVSGSGAPPDRRTAWLEALQRGQQDAAHAREQSDGSQLAFLHAKIGCAYDRLGFISESKAHLEQALDLFQQNGDAANALRARCNLGTVEVKYRLFLDDLFMYHLEMAIHGAEANGDERRLAELNWKRGRAWREDDYFRDALWCLDEACARLTALGDYAEAHRVARELIWTCMEMGHHHQALEVGRSAIAHLKEHPEGGEYGLLLCLMAMLYGVTEAYEMAEESYQQALILLREAGEQRLLGHSLAHLGILSLWQGKTAQGIGYIRQGLDSMPTALSGGDALKRRAVERLASTCSTSQSSSQ